MRLNSLAAPRKGSEPFLLPLAQNLPGASGVTVVGEKQTTRKSKMKQTMKTECLEKLVDATDWICRLCAWSSAASIAAIIAAAPAAIFGLAIWGQDAFMAFARILAVGMFAFAFSVLSLKVFARVHYWAWDMFIASWTQAVGEPPVVEE